MNITIKNLRNFLKKDIGEFVIVNDYSEGKKEIEVRLLTLFKQVENISEEIYHAFAEYKGKVEVVTVVLSEDLDIFIGEGGELDFEEEEIIKIAKRNNLEF